MNPVWANSSYLTNPRYGILLREFMAWDVLRAEPFHMDIRDGEAKMVYTEFTPIVNHWSRLFEYPWAIEAADLKKTDVVLDAGGGNALIQYAAALRASHVVNVDASDHYLDSVNNGLLRSYVRNLTLETGDLRKLRYPDAWFDKIFCISVLEHTSEPEAILGELLRVLKPGGRLIVSLDIMEAPHPNFILDEQRTICLIAPLLLEYPVKPPNTLVYYVRVEDFPDGKVQYAQTTVLCFSYDKEA